nr:cupin domain-containing protein [Azohydromonas australica]
MHRTLLGAACAVLAFAPALPAGAGSLTEQVTPQFAHALPNVPGKSLVSVVVEYGPGAASRPHTHAKSAFIYAYVLSGVVETQVDGEAPRIVRAGESFHEVPGAHHTVSRNASATEPARLLAVFVVDSSESRTLTSPDR